MAGKDLLEKAKADALVDYMADIYDPVYRLMKNKELHKLVSKQIILSSITSYELIF